MKKSDIKKLSIQEIDLLIQQLNDIKKDKEKKINVINELIKKAQENDISINEIKNELSTKNSLKNKEIKYKTIINGIEVKYSGRGKKPKWFIDFINKGGDPKSIEVNKEDLQK